MPKHRHTCNAGCETDALWLCLCLASRVDRLLCGRFLHGFSRAVFVVGPYKPDSSREGVVCGAAGGISLRFIPDSLHGTSSLAKFHIPPLI